MESNGDIFEKAEQLTDRLTGLRERMDGTVFKGESADGTVKLALWGTGEPVAVSLTGPFSDDVRDALVRGIEEALVHFVEARDAFMNEALESIRNEVGVGPDLQLPF